MAFPMNCFHTTHKVESLFCTGSAYRSSIGKANRVIQTRFPKWVSPGSPRKAADQTDQARNQVFSITATGDEVQSRSLQEDTAASSLVVRSPNYNERQQWVGGQHAFPSLFETISDQNVLCNHKKDVHCSDKKLWPSRST